MPNVNLVTGNDGGNTLQGTAGSDLIYGYDPDGPQSQVTTITANRVATGLSQPLFAISPPGDTSRLFIVEKTGKVEILDLGTGQVKATPFLNVSAQIGTAGEEGLLGLAFDPNYAQNGFIYVNLVNTSGDTEIRRYHVSADPNVIAASSATLVLSIDQPNATNHKGGWVGFGPDGYLYAALGDGGGGGDPFHNGQNAESLLGKMLRLDVHANAFPGDPNKNYAIPADNPFVGVAGADELYALGLRNPWRPSFDRVTGDFFIADVGQDTWEEINVGIKGANYGWNHYEGPATFSGGDPLSSVGALTFPIYSYDHSVGHSITGGYVYRGPAEALQGQYFFADFVNNKVFTLRSNGTSWVATEQTAKLAPDVGAINSPSSFGQDALGNLYLVDIDGDVFRLTPNVSSSDLGDQLNGLGGDDFLFGGSGNDTLHGGDGNDELHGGHGVDMLFGDANNDLLEAADGDDTLDGGANADVMVGSLGNDLYFVDNVADVVIENAGEGNDIVYASIDYTLAANVESVVLQGAANLNAAGNGDANALIGNSGNNALDGEGGADFMVGGAGNDNYFADSSSDVVMENSNEGSDIVYASVDYTIGANVEAVVLQGIANLNAAGSNQVNALIGNSGNNALDGKGGDDYMVGGGGNDIYFADSSSDVVVENVNEGADIVYASVDYTIGTNVESVVLQGSSNLNAAGNSGGNALIGNSANNALDGRGGTDYLVGGGGNDTFVFSANEANGDVIADFDGAGSSAGDSLRFIGYGAGSFTNIDATHWSINSANGAVHDIITLQNGAAIAAGDYSFA